MNHFFPPIEKSEFQSESLPHNKGIITLFLVIKKWGVTVRKRKFQ